MTHDDAMRLLGIDQEGSDSGAVEEAYASLAAEAARRIASAPTPALREKYRQQAERLRQARDLLLDDGRPRNDPAPLSLTKQLDLPARGPIATGHTGPGAAEPPGDHPLTLTRQADLPARSPVGTGSGRSEPDGSDAVEAAAVGVRPGQVLADRYEVRAHLGSGGMGQVFAVLDRLRQEEIAVKVLLPHLLADPKVRERFLNEARIASSLSHPHIVRVFDVQQAAGLTFLTMELLEGRSLREEIARRQQTAQRFSVAEVVSIAQSLCAALQYAHGLTVHRDVQPENIWLVEDGTAKLMDFGIARLLRPSQFTSTGLALGTAYYMAPEQLRGQEVDHRADQFALAVVLYELLTGEIPQGVIKPPHQLRRSVPSGMSQAVMKALEARPEPRHADMAAFERALAARSGSGIGARVVGAAAVAILLGAIVTFPVWRSWTDGMKDDSGPASVTPGVTAEAKAAEAAYGKLAALDEHIDALLARGKADLNAERFAAAERFQAVLKIRPGDATAGQLARRAEIGVGIARVKEHDQAGEREEALTALADLRKLAADDADVRVELDGHVQALLAKGKEELAAERFDTALQEFQRILKLRPGDATATLAIHQVEMGRRIAGIKNLNRSGDRAQALAALDSLRKLAPDDAGVKALRDSIYDARRAITNTVGMKLELIPAGEFLMGSTNDDKDAFDGEKPQHRVRITRPFYLGATEVTRGQFRRFVDDAGYRTEAERDGKGGYGLHEAGNWVQDPKFTWQNPGFEQTEEHPVVNVSWNDAVAFAAWSSRKEGTTYRLPTEAEWEYACRTGTTTKYSSGDDPESLATVGNIADGTAKEKYPNWTWTIAARDGFVYTAPVGRYNPNAWGLFDMHGNVWEWCSDGYAADYYRRSLVDDPQGAEGASARVGRGGGWRHTPRSVGSAYRSGGGPEDRATTWAFAWPESSPSAEHGESSAGLA